MANIITVIISMLAESAKNNVQNRKKAGRVSLSVIPFLKEASNAENNHLKLN
ncbi:hypothetical protein [Neisseria sp. HMSC077D05]|uniref:hypothetical protein n=1 Tax=Neisseria sp. HMSC077D05 TaxID=1715079 RepID=UPI00143B43E6|nr:hypothetical protein [Neisseria sp. HMSC077D05]